MRIQTFRRLLLMVIFTLIAFFACSQQLPLYTQYMMNSYLLNPGVAGHDGLSTVTLSAREQWLGFKNAPRTVAITGHTRLLKSRRPGLSRNLRSGNVGLGGMIYSDRNGALHRTGVGVTYAYHIWMGQNQLSFGTSLTAFQLRIDRDSEILHNPDDPLLLNLSGALFVPDVDFGIYWSNPNYYIGLSSLQMFESSAKFGNDGFRDYKIPRHYYLMMGHAIHYGNKLVLEPSVLIQTNWLQKPIIDLNTKVYYADDWWAGISYRTNRAAILMLGVKVQNMYIGYSYDYNLSNIRKHNLGSHEFMVSMKFGDTSRRYRWLNRY
jgi:type IX secretion system PorP/SprF family membrane protein